MRKRTFFKKKGLTDGVKVEAMQKQLADRGKKQTKKTKNKKKVNF